MLGSGFYTFPAAAHFNHELPSEAPAHFHSVNEPRLLAGAKPPFLLKTNRIPMPNKAPLFFLRLPSIHLDHYIYLPI